MIFRISDSQGSDEELKEELDLIFSSEPDEKKQSIIATKKIFNLKNITIFGTNNLTDEQ